MIYFAVDAEKLVRQKWRLLKATMDERAGCGLAPRPARSVRRCGGGRAGDGNGDQHGEEGPGRGACGGAARGRRQSAAQRGKRPYEAAHPEVWPALELVDPIREATLVAIALDVQSTHVLSSEMFVQHGVRISDKTVAAAAAVQPPGSEQICRGRAAPRPQRAVRAHQRQGSGLSRPGCAGDLRRRRRRNSSATSRTAARSGNRRASPNWSMFTTFPTTLSARRSVGVYDIAANDGFTWPTTTRPLAVVSIEAWWTGGFEALPDAGDLHHRRRRRQQWPSLSRVEARTPAARRQAQPVDPRQPFPAGPSKWNKIEHRLFSFISMNWRGRPLRTYETVVTFSNTTTGAACSYVPAGPAQVPDRPQGDCQADARAEDRQRSSRRLELVSGRAPRRADPRLSIRGPKAPPAKGDQRAMRLQRTSLP